MGRNKQAFTLIELLLVISLISFLVLFTTPRFMDFNTEQQLHKAVSDVVNNLHYIQNQALSGVQGELSHISYYQFALYHNASDPADVYRGYELKRFDDTDLEITPELKEKEFSCPICINSSEQLFNFSVPTGSIGGFSGSNHTMTVCLQGVGFHTVTIETSGRIYASDFQTSSCTCDLASC